MIKVVNDHRIKEREEGSIEILEKKKNEDQRCKWEWECNTGMNDTFLSLYILYKEYHSQKVVMVINLIFGFAMYMCSNSPYQII